MLRVIRATIGQTEVEYALQRLPLTASSLLLRVSDGVAVFEGEFSAERDRPRSRPEAAEAYMAALEEAFTLSSGKHSFQTSLSDDSLGLTVFETVDASIRLCLVKLTLRRCEDGQQAMLRMLTSAADSMLAVQRDLLRKEEENQFLRQQAREASAQLSEAARMKTELQTEILTKACLLLNEKKQEIRELRAKVEELEKTPGQRDSRLNHGGNDDAMLSVKSEGPPVPVTKRESPMKMPSPMRARKPAAKTAPAVPRIRRTTPDVGTSDPVLNQMLSSRRTEVMSGRDIISNPDILFETSSGHNVKAEPGVDPLPYENAGGEGVSESSKADHQAASASTVSDAQSSRRRMRTMLDASDSDE